MKRQMLVCFYHLLFLLIFVFSYPCKWEEESCKGEALREGVSKPQENAQVMDLPLPKQLSFNFLASFLIPRKKKFT
jgi:hypothetical protein